MTETAVRVELLQPFRGIVGQDALTIPLGRDESVSRLLERLAEEYQKLRNGLYDRDGNINSFVNVLVNGKPIAILDGLQTRLKDKDVVLVFLAVAGG